MADTLTATIILERNGQVMPGFPVVRRVSADEFAIFSSEQANADGTFTAPTAVKDIVTLKFVYYTADQTTKLLFDNNSDTAAPLELDANGILLLINTTINSGTSTNLTIENDSGNTAKISGIVGGT